MDKREKFVWKNTLEDGMLPAYNINFFEIEKKKAELKDW